jgi:hypothetical protein
MAWSYCDNCGTTAIPKRKVTVKVVLEGGIRGDERTDVDLDADVYEDEWVCSECGKKVKVGE